MPDQSFPPAARLHDQRDYSRVFNRQQKAAGRHVVVLVRPRAGRESPERTARLGIMVSTKVAKNATRRHQLKRWVRELFRTRLQETLAGHELVVLFLGDLPGGDGDHALLDQEILALLPKALAARPDPRQGGRSGGKGGPGGGKPGSARAGEAKA